MNLKHTAVIFLVLLFEIHIKLNSDELVQWKKEG